MLGAAHRRIRRSPEIPGMAAAWKTKTMPLFQPPKPAARQAIGLKLSRQLDLFAFADPKRLIGAIRKTIGLDAFVGTLLQILFQDYRRSDRVDRSFTLPGASSLTRAA